ncbi:MAG: acyltransferase [Candidatus Daviesbacteria bacterium]|nr:acyltransferase [Candidatus Daviesbacteria bacterium]
MKATEEIGVEKTIRFIVYAILQFIYGLLILPPLRKVFLTLLGAKIGSNSIIMNVKFFNWHHKGPQGLVIGSDCFIGDETLIDLYGSVTLENEVTLAQRVTVLTHLNVGYFDHPLQKYFPKSTKPVLFKRGSVIAATVTILPGVTIGHQSFVAAGSVVTKNVPDKTLVAGVPARSIRKIKGG